MDDSQRHYSERHYYFNSKLFIKIPMSILKSLRKEALRDIIIYFEVPNLMNSSTFIYSKALPSG